MSITDVTEGIDMGLEESSLAEEYFSSGSSGAGAVESFVNDHLLDQVTEKCEEDEIDDETADSPFVRSTKFRKAKHQQHSGDKTRNSSGIQRDSNKRLSATSKTSSDSSNSNFSRTEKSKSLEPVAVADSLTEYESEATTEDKAKFDSVDSGVGLTSIVSKDSTSSKSLETALSAPPIEAINSSKKETAQQISWNKAQETIEISKKNVEILRQNAARPGSIFANGRSNATNTGTINRKRHFDRLHPFHTHMLLYNGVYDTKQVLYAFQTLRNIIACDCRTFLCLSITTSLSNSPMKQLLIR